MCPLPPCLQVGLPYLRSKLLASFSAHRRQRDTAALWSHPDASQSDPWASDADAAFAADGDLMGDESSSSSAGSAASSSGSSPGGTERARGTGTTGERCDGPEGDLPDAAEGGGRGGSGGAAEQQQQEQQQEEEQEQEEQEEGGRRAGQSSGAGRGAAWAPVVSVRIRRLLRQWRRVLVRERCGVTCGSDCTVALWSEASPACRTGALHVRTD